MVAAGNGTSTSGFAEAITGLGKLNPRQRDVHIKSMLVLACVRKKSRLTHKAVAELAMLTIRLAAASSR
jgi:hypothetical protein